MDQNTVWVLAIAALTIGMLIGFLFGKSRSNESREMKLADELDKVQRETALYRNEVDEHFSKTAELVNGLTNQYQKVHEHLATGAEQLCRDEKLVAALQKSGHLSLTTQNSEKESKAEAPKAATKAIPSAELKEDKPVTAPLDYAPKALKDEPGTLSDKYGLRGESKDELPEPSDNFIEPDMKKS